MQPIFLDQRVAKLVKGEQKMSGPSFDYYTKGRDLGRGAYGAVSEYKLKDLNVEGPNFPKIMAVKTVESDAKREPDMCKFSNKNIVQFHGVETIDDTTYIKMEAAKHNLRKFQRDIVRGPVFGSNFLHLAVQIAEAVKYLHKRDFAHRDIKPHNILVFWHGDDTNPPISHVTLKLCDFGLTRAVPEDSIASMTVVGTPAYFAPEVELAIERKIKFAGDYKKVDIYCCGIVFLELLLNELPEKTKQAGSSNYNLANKDLCSSVWEEYVALLSLMLHKKPIKRISAKGVVSFIKPWHTEEIHKQQFRNLQMKNSHQEQQLKLNEQKVSQLTSKVSEQKQQIKNMQRKSNDQHHQQQQITLTEQKNVKQQLQIKEMQAKINEQQQQVLLIEQKKNKHQLEMRELQEKRNELQQQLMVSEQNNIQQQLQIQEMQAKRNEQKQQLLETEQRSCQQQSQIQEMSTRSTEQHKQLAFFKQKSSMLLTQVNKQKQDISDKERSNSELKILLEIARSTISKLHSEASENQKTKDEGHQAQGVSCDPDKDWYNVHQAALDGNIEEVRRLLDAGYNTNSTDSYGNTPLHDACKKGHLSVAQILIERGADVNGACNNGLTPLHFACFNGHLLVAQLLLRKDAHMNKTEAKGLTPLHSACTRGHFPVAKLLLENRADKGAKSKAGKTPLDMVKGRNKEFVELFGQF